MANELAAIAQMPNGATITVIIICAQQMMVCSMPIGRPIRKAFRMVSSFGRKQPLFFAKLNSGERYHKYHNITAATNDSATTVPKAAPPTPKPALILSLMFSQTMFFLTDYIDIEAIQALKESVRIMRGKKGKLFYLQLSFIGIYLLGAIACGIGLLWVIPYMQVTMANFYRKITGEI